MHIERRELVDLLQALGVDTADRWPNEKLQERVNAGGGVARYVSPARLAELRDAPERFPTLARLVSAQDAGGRVIVIQTDPEGDEMATKVKKAAKKARAAAAKPQGAPTKYPKGWAEWPEPKKLEYWRKHPRREPAAGIAAAVIRELRAAGKANKFVSKDFLVGILAAEFPGRDATGMRTNVSNMLPGRLRDVYGLPLEKGVAADGSVGYRLPPAAK